MKAICLIAVVIHHSTNLMGGVVEFQNEVDSGLGGIISKEEGVANEIGRYNRYTLTTFDGEIYSRTISDRVCFELAYKNREITIFAEPFGNGLFEDFIGHPIKFLLSEFLYGRSEIEFEYKIPKGSVEEEGNRGGVISENIA